MKYLFILAFLINSLSWLSILVFVPETNFPFIVKYSVFAGQDIFGNKISLFSLPALGLLILLINVILASLLMRSPIEENRGLSKLILWLTCFAELLILAYAGFMIFINNY